MDTGYYERPKDYSSRPDSSFIDTVSYMIIKLAGHKIYFRHLKEIYEKQNSGIGPFEFVNQILNKYKNNVDKKGKHNGCN